MVLFLRTIFFALLSIGVCATVTAKSTFNPKSLKVAGLIYQPVKWDKDANTTRLKTAIRQAKNDGAQLVVTPEGALEGYLVNDVRKSTGKRREKLTKRFNQIAEPIDGPYIRQFRKLCKEIQVALVLGFLEKDGEKTYNTAVLIGPDGTIVGKYRKTHFAQGYKMGLEKGNNPIGYMRGTDYPVFEVAGRKLGIMICYDRRVSKVAKQLAENGAEMIVNPAYGMMGDCNRKFIAARAKENHVPVLFVHPDQAILALPDGKITVDARPEKDDARDRKSVV